MFLLTMKEYLCFFSQRLNEVINCNTKAMMHVSTFFPLKIHFAQST